jgi:hypothetical protein
MAKQQNYHGQLNPDGNFHDYHGNINEVGNYQNYNLNPDGD